MKNSKKGVLYAIMAVVGLSGVSARADTPSWLKSRGTRFGTAATGARDWTKQAGADFYDWAGKHKKEIGIGLGAAAGAAALGAGTRYGYKTYKQRQVVPSIPRAPAIPQAPSIPQAVAIPDAQGAQAAAIPDAPGAKVADKSALFAAIRAGKKLKSVEPPVRLVSEQKGLVDNLRAVIEARRGVMKAEPDDDDDSDSDVDWD